MNDIDIERLVRHLQQAAVTTQDRANRAAVDKDETKAVVCDEMAELLRVLASALNSARR